VFSSTTEAATAAAIAAVATAAVATTPISSSGMAVADCDDDCERWRSDGRVRELISGFASEVHHEAV